MRIADKPPSTYPWYLRLLLRSQRRRFGEPLKPTLLWGRVPALLFTFLAFQRVLERARSPLRPALRALVMTRVSQLNHCAFCIDLNAHRLARQPGSRAQAAAVAQWREHPQFDAAERAALDYAEAMTLAGSGVTDAQVAELRRHFSDDAIVELTALIGMQNLSSKFNAALGVPAHGFCERD